MDTYSYSFHELIGLPNVNDNMRRIGLKIILNDIYYKSGTFKKNKLKDQKMIKRKGYYLNPITYELEDN